MSAVTLDSQRTALYDILVALDIGQVDKYPRSDPIPPVTMITDPRIEFPDNSILGIVEWSIWMLAERKAPAAVSGSLDIDMPAILLALSKGAGIGYVLRRVESTVRTIEGYTLPGYNIIGTAPLPNC